MKTGADLTLCSFLPDSGVPSGKENASDVFEELDHTESKKSFSKGSTFKDYDFSDFYDSLQWMIF